MREEKPAMLRQIESIPALMREIGPAIHAEAEAVAAKLDKGLLRRVVLTGCGDSWAVAVAAKQAMLEYTDLCVDAVPVIDLARHYPARQLAGRNGDTLTVIISNSGNVSRAVELAKRIRLAGGKSLAITGNKASDLYAQTDYQLLLNVPKFSCSGPGMRSYCACLLGAFELAAALGTGAFREELTALPDIIEAALPQWAERSLHAANTLAACTAYEFAASGADFATAWFGFAKELEAVAAPGCAINNEDWLHMNYFVRDVPGTALLPVANAAAGDASRSREVIRVAAEMGRPLLVITDDGAAWGDVPALTTPALVHPVLHALTQYLPLSMVISHLGVMRGETYFRSTQDRWTACIGFATVAGSEQIMLEEQT